MRQLNLVNLDTVAQIKDTTEQKLNAMFSKYKNLCNGELTKITGLQAKLKLKTDSKPVFIKARRVPFKLVPLVDKEIDRLVECGIFESVPSAEWATPVVPVLKPKKITL